MVQVYLIGDVPFEGAPAEKPIKDSDAHFLPDYPVVLEVVVLGHFLHVLLDEVVDVLAEEIQVGFPQDLLGVLLVHQVLQKQHEQQVEGLELPPLDLTAHQLPKLDHPVSNANIPPSKTHAAPSIQMHVHLRKHFDFVQVVLVQLCLRHLFQQLAQLNDSLSGRGLPHLLLLFSFRRKEVLFGGGRRQLGLCFFWFFFVEFVFDGGTSSFFVLGGRFDDFAWGLGRLRVTFPSCFCLMWVKRAA